MRQKDRFEILLEDLHSRFDLQVEGLSGTNERLDRLDLRQSRVEQKLESLDLLVSSLEFRLGKVETRLDKIEYNTEGIRDDLRRHVEYTEQRFEAHDKRLTALEKSTA